MPIGVLAPLAMARGRRLGWLLALAGGTALSATLEAAQYAVGRSADIDDVILNAIGVGCGVALAVAVRRVWTRRGTTGLPRLSTR